VSFVAICTHHELNLSVVLASNDQFERLIWDKNAVNGRVEALPILPNRGELNAANAVEVAFAAAV